MRTFASQLKAEIKRRPRLYDFVMFLSRRVLLRRTPAFMVLDQFSRALGRGVSFIQVGAGDGLRRDPIREFIVRDNWTGVMIEPLPRVFALLKANYAHLSARRDLVFENAAISSTDSTLSFYTVAEGILSRVGIEEQLDLLQKSSVHRKHIEQFLQSPADVVQVSVPCTSIESVVHRHFQARPIDLLLIDAEGYESVILRSIDFSKIPIKAIFFESLHLGSGEESLIEHLTSQGFVIRRLQNDAFGIRGSNLLTTLLPELDRVLPHNLEIT
jgi:FkbM family methyltransferase